MVDHGGTPEDLMDIQTEIVANGLESAEAKAFLETMPTAAQLMQAITVEEMQKVVISNKGPRV
jgi:hypothetical protein